MPLSNSQYDELFRGYHARQLEHARRQQEHIREVYARDARLKELDDQIAALSVSQAKKLLDGDTAALNDLKQSIHALHRKKEELLCGLGYNLDYISLHYTCPDCKDTGYIDGKRCHCFVQAAIDLVYTQSNLKGILEDENFSHFCFDYYSDDILDPATGISARACAEHAVSTCRRFIEHFDDSFDNLCFYGEAGVGKTFLSHCVAKELLDSRHSVIYFTAFQLFDIFEKSMLHKDADAALSHRNIFDCDLLIIDDLGTELANAFTTSRLFLCLNERMLQKKSTLISTNLTMEELSAVYSERICSRIFSNYTMIKLFGDDIRLQKKLH